MKRLLSFLAALMLMGATPLAASATAKAEMTIIKSEQFTSTDKNEVYDFEEGFTQNGYEYHLISNTTSIIKTDDNAKVQTKQQEVVTSDLSEKSYEYLLYSVQYRAETDICGRLDFFSTPNE